MIEENLIQIFDKKEFRNWLDKNHDKETKIGLILHKKHTGKGSPSHKELMFEAICYGWIDTTIRGLDEDKFIRFFSRRNKNSSWSYNTLGYAKQLIKEKRMTPHGLKFYKEGLKKKPHDYGIPKNPDIPEELKKELEKNKNKKLKNLFEELAPSMKRAHYRWIIRAKQKETKTKRINFILNSLGKKDEKWMKNV